MDGSLSQNLLSVGILRPLVRIRLRGSPRFVQLGVMFYTKKRTPWTSASLFTRDVLQSQSIFERSGDLPLELTLLDSAFVQPHDNERLVDGFRQRLRVLDVNPVSSDLGAAALIPHLFNAPLPKLERLRLCGDEDGVSNPSNGWPFKTEYAAQDAEAISLPSLQCLHLANIRLTTTLVAPQLRTLVVSGRFGSLFFKYLRELLDSSVSLEELCVYDCSVGIGDRIEHVERPNTSLHHLSRWEVRDIGFVQLFCLFVCFAAPNLVSLTIRELGRMFVPLHQSHLTMANLRYLVRPTFHE